MRIPKTWFHAKIFRFDSKDITKLMIENFFWELCFQVVVKIFLLEIYLGMIWQMLVKYSFPYVLQTQQCYKTTGSPHEMTRTPTGSTTHHLHAV